MYCTKCGAEIYDNESFCSKCGSAAKGRQKAAPSVNSYYQEAEQRAANSINAPYVINITPEKAAEMMKRTSGEDKASSAAKSRKKRKKSKNKGALWVVAILLVVIVLLICLGVASNWLNATTPQEIINALAGEFTANTDDIELASDENTTSSEAAAATSSEYTTTATTTTAASFQYTTTTTTVAATTTTARTSSQQALLAQQAQEICRMLVKNKWSTTVGGYDAVITFYEDGTALIEVDVNMGLFSVTQSVEATYEVSSRCFAIIKGNYNGMELGISGTVTKISDKELLVDRGADLGTLTLKAV